MTKAKKALSLVLAAVMLLGVMSVAAFAADAPTGSEATISFNFDRTSYAAGDTVTLEVALQSNYFVGPTAIPVQYKTDAVSFTSGVNTVTPAAVFGSVAATDMAVNTATPGEVYVALTPLASQNAVAQTYTNAATIFTVTFTAVTAIADPAAAFGVLDDQKTMTHLSGKLFVGTYATSDIRSTVYSTGQTLNFPVLEEAAGDPELILTSADNGAVIDRTRCTTSSDYAGCVYGIDTIGEAAEMISDFVTTEIGSVTVVANDYGAESTGATIQLLNASGEVVETYLFIYFGDVNGDGAVDIADAGAAEAHDGWLELIDEDSAAFYAADVVVDGIVDIADAGAIEAHDGWLETLPLQSEIAASFA